MEFLKKAFSITFSCSPKGDRFCLLQKWPQVQLSTAANNIKIKEGGRDIYKTLPFLPMDGSFTPLSFPDAVNKKPDVRLGILQTGCLQEAWCSRVVRNGHSGWKIHSSVKAEKLGPALVYSKKTSIQFSFLSFKLSCIRSFKRGELRPEFWLFPIHQTASTVCTYNGLLSIS